MSDTRMLGAGADSDWSRLLTFQEFCKLIVKQPLLKIKSYKFTKNILKAELISKAHHCIIIF